MTLILVDKLIFEDSLDLSETEILNRALQVASEEGSFWRYKPVTTSIISTQDLNGFKRYEIAVYGELNEL